MKKSNFFDITLKRKKSRLVTLLLCIFLGSFGVHKFYVGKVGMGILYLFTVQQKGGLAGLGAGVALGNTMIQGIQSTTKQSDNQKDKVEQLRELKSLLDEGILTQEEFDAEKKAILSK